MKTPLPNDLTYAEHPSDIIAKAAQLVQAGCPFALVTSMAIDGGAAREVGSLALVETCGAMTGYLSNGCIDRDIQLHAVDALQSKHDKLIRYGDGSRYADLKLPCGGSLTVLIDPIPDTEVIVRAAADFAERRAVSLSFQGDTGKETEIHRTFTYHPRHRLVLAGRGAIFRSMAQIGKAIGFDLHLLSPDEQDLVAAAPLSDADPIHLTSPHRDIALDMLDGHSAFLTLFHDHDWEPMLLRAALQSPARFIGSLGSRRTHNMRRETLRGLGVPDSALARLHGPIGLVPSLRDAPSIAVSTLAEIVAGFRADEANPHAAPLCHPMGSPSNPHPR